jgi:hypothetical protein
MTTDDNATQRPGATREGLLARYPLIFYFDLTRKSGKDQQSNDGLHGWNGFRTGGRYPRMDTNFQQQH